MIRLLSIGKKIKKVCKAFIIALLQTLELAGAEGIIFTKNTANYRTSEVKQMAILLGLRHFCIFKQNLNFVQNHRNRVRIVDEKGAKLARI